HRYLEEWAYRTGVLQTLQRADRVSPNDIGWIRQILDQVARERMPGHRGERIHRTFADPPIFVAQVSKELWRQVATLVANAIDYLDRDTAHVQIAAAQEPQNGTRGLDLS